MILSVQNIFNYSMNNYSLTFKITKSNLSYTLKWTKGLSSLIARSGSSHYLEKDVISRGVVVGSLVWRRRPRGTKLTRETEGCWLTRRASYPQVKDQVEKEWWGSRGKATPGTSKAIPHFPCGGELPTVCSDCCFSPRKWQEGPGPNNSPPSLSLLKSREKPNFRGISFPDITGRNMCLTLCVGKDFTINIFYSRKMGLCYMTTLHEVTWNYLL